MDLEKLKEDLRGPMVPMVTPLKENFELDLEGLRRNARFYVEHGLVNGKAALMCATAGGECASLNLADRKRVMDVVASEVRGKVPIIMSAQDCSIDVAIELAEYAEGLRYDCVQLSPPFYWGTSKDEVYRFFSLVAKTIDIGILPYNTTWLGILGGIGIDAELMGRLLNIPNIVGVKWSSPNWYIWMEVMRKYSDKVAFIDNQYHGLGRLYGASGYLSVTSEFAPEYGLNLWETMGTGDMKRILDELWRLQLPYYQWIGKLEKAGINGEGVPVKAAVGMVGLAAGPAKPPYDHELPEHLKKELKQILINAGIKDKNGNPLE